MNVLMISPGFPTEMPFFTRGLATVGARVIGLGDQHESALPQMARESLSAYIQVHSFGDEGAVLRQVHDLSKRVRIDRVECQWETQMIAAAKMREMLGVPGMTVAETIPFRDKEIMKQVLDKAGIRTPRHASATTVAGVQEAVERIGYPIVVKPIAGAGSTHTYRLDSARDLEAVIPSLRHVDEVSIEEFIDGEDYTFDTLCVDGEILYENVAFYRPRAMLIKEHEWVSPQTIAVRSPMDEAYAPGREMGLRVLAAMGFKTGMTHMEWYRTASGEAVFGEIAARPPGAHLVDLMNFACDIDLYVGWAEAVCHARFTQPVERKYNAAWIFKRAQGQGRIQRIEGLDRLMAEIGQHICAIDLAVIGEPRRNWKQVLAGDGKVFIRHPDLQTTLELADRVGVELQLYAG